MKQVTMIILLFIFPGTAGSVQAQSNKKNVMDTKEAILQLHQQLLDAIAQKKATILETNMHPDFVFTAATGDVWERNKFIKGFALNPAIQFPLFTASQQQIIIVDKTAIVTALVQIHIVRGDKPKEELWERTTETYVQEGNKWRLLAMQATFTKP